jgi:peptidyl-Lys metalloendopeptidase
MSLIFISLLISLALAQFDISIDIISENPLELNFTVTNTESLPQSFLRWGTPLEGVLDDMFDIRDASNTRMDYIGKIVMRDEPIMSDYITLPAGSSISTTVNLGDNYEFTTVGKFIVKVDLPQFAELPYSATSQVATVFQLNTIPVPPKRSMAPQGFVNCNANQISYANAAISGGASECASSYNCLQGSSCDTRYNRWFGTKSDSNFNFVTPCFRNINSRLTGSTFNGNCDTSSTCSSNTFAYVYPTDSNMVVYLCPLFFSRSGDRNRVIVHEMSHFRAICGTQDYTYGTTNCLSLARSNPSQAARNADNVCYFAGNY